MDTKPFELKVLHDDPNHAFVFMYAILPTSLCLMYNQISGLMP